MLLSIAVNRFRWVGLPPTCDPRYLEQQLHKTGIATICHSKETPDIWQTLSAATQSEFNAYGIPTKWDGLITSQIDTAPKRLLIWDSYNTV